MIDPTSEAQRELQPGETVLWTGQPDTKQVAIQVLPVTIFGIAFIAVAIYMFLNWSSTSASTATSQPSAPRLFLLLPILFGLGAVSAPYWYAKIFNSVVYAVTNHRIMVIRCGKKNIVSSWPPIKIGVLRYTERPDGSGTLTFATHNSGNGGRAKDQLIGIPNVANVERLIVNTLKGGKNEYSGLARQEAAMAKQVLKDVLTGKLDKSALESTLAQIKAEQAADAAGQTVVDASAVDPNDPPVQASQQYPLR